MRRKTDKEEKGGKVEDGVMVETEQKTKVSRERRQEEEGKKQKSSGQ